MHQLVQFLKLDGLVNHDLRLVAYMLATVKHETGGTYLPVREKGNRNYFARYEASTNRGASLGNVRTGDGSRYKGRGYVQITGRANYRRLSEVVGVNLEAYPDKALVPEIAYRIMSQGMAYGLFTGVGMVRFINADKTDFVNARKVVNGLDKAKLIAGYAEEFLADLFDGGFDAIRI